MEVVHELVRWEIKYGYIKLLRSDAERMVKELPPKFDVTHGKNVEHERYIDSSNRIYVGRSFMSRFVLGQKLIVKVSSGRLNIVEQ